jgi:hypothetical protein
VQFCLTNDHFAQREASKSSGECRHVRQLLVFPFDGTTQPQLAQRSLRARAVRLQVYADDGVLAPARSPPLRCWLATLHSQLNKRRVRAPTFKLLCLEVLKRVS